MLSRRLVVTLLLCSSTVAFAQGGAAPSIEGVWRIAEIVTTGANASKNTTPQPSLVIFARGHYSFLSVNGTTPRKALEPAKDPAKLTDAEKIARYDQWQPFTANSGTYEIKGTTLTRRPIVAKNVAAMTNTSIVEEFKLEKDALWLTNKSPAGQPSSETQTRLVRIR